MRSEGRYGQVSQNLDLLLTMFKGEKMAEVDFPEKYLLCPVMGREDPKLVQDLVF